MKEQNNVNWRTFCKTGLNSKKKKAIIKKDKDDKLDRLDRLDDR